MKAVTVILVSDVSEDLKTGTDWLEAPFSEATMRTIYSVEQQTNPNWDLSIVRRVDETPVLALYRWAAERAETEWLSFIEEGEEWPPEMLGRMLQMMHDGDSGGSCSIPPAEGRIVRRDFYLAGQP